MDAERAAGHVRGPLHGIPVMVKDNLDAAGLPTTAGCVALENCDPGPGLAGRREAARRGRGPARQAQPVRVRELPLQRPDAERLLVARRPGAEPVQRGHHAERLLERLRRRGRRRPRGGHDRHRDLRLDHVSPAAAQSDVGLRPTVGLVSRTGILPISATQDTAGPITRTVADAAAELRRDRRQGPGGPGHGHRAGHRAGLPRRALSRRAGRASGSASSASNNAQYTAAIAVDPGARRDDGHGRRRRTPRATPRSSSRSSSATSPRTSAACPRARR